jgi:hypothetical protein
MKDKKDVQPIETPKFERSEIPLHLNKEALDKLIQEKFKRAERYSKALSTR